MGNDERRGSPVALSLGPLETDSVLPWEKAGGAAVPSLVGSEIECVRVWPRRPPVDKDADGIEVRKGDEGNPFGGRAVPLNAVRYGPADGGETGHECDGARPVGTLPEVEFTRFRGGD
jgi:hypothetical protein